MGSVFGFSYNHDGKLLAAACGFDRFGKVAILDAASGKPVADLIAGSVPLSVSFDPDGKSVTAIGSDVVTRWRIGEVLRTREGDKGGVKQPN